jgi:hypothetical protein
MSEARSHGTAATPYRPPVCGRGCAVRGKVSVGGLTLSAYIISLAKGVA